jgi:circadian clock protein KaiC
MSEVTEGGIPKGRPTLVCGGSGAGKTFFLDIDISEQQ